MAAPRLLEIGTEVVAPFADTVRFIDHEQRDAGVFQRFDGFLFAGGLVDGGLAGPLGIATRQSSPLTGLPKRWVCGESH